MERRLRHPSDVHLRRGELPVHGRRTERPHAHRVRAEARLRTPAEPRGTGPACVAPGAYVRRPAVRPTGPRGGGALMTDPRSPRDPLRFDPALLRGFTQRRLSRRGFLRVAGVGAGAMALAACGVSGTAPKPAATTGSGSGSPSPEDLSKFYGDGKPAGQLNFANWEDYIDVDESGASPTLQQFTKQTGIKVEYKTVIADNDSFLARIIPVLQNGQDTGFDIIVITNGGPVERMIKLGFLTPLDHQYLPNFKANASESVTDPSYDPGNRYS